MKKLASSLREIDENGYDDSRLIEILNQLNELEDWTQDVVIQSALELPDIKEGQSGFDMLLHHIKSLFVILKQRDRQGSYCGLGFEGNDGLISVATWEGWSIPTGIKQIDRTEECQDGDLRCGHLLGFVNFWMDKFDVGIHDFLVSVRVEIH